MHRWVDTPRTLFSFIKYVLLYAPDRFPVEDFLRADEQMNLRKAFEELNHGLSILAPKIGDAAIVEKLQNLLNSSCRAYQSGDVENGGTLLNEFDLIAFSKEWAMIELPDQAKQTNRPN